MDYEKSKLNQLHAVSCTQQGRQREPSVRHCVPHFPPNSEALHFEWRNSIPRFTSMDIINIIQKCTNFKLLI